MKKYLILVFIILLSATYVNKFVIADSGWDANYDSASSSTGSNINGRDANNFIEIMIYLIALMKKYPITAVIIFITGTIMILLKIVDGINKKQQKSQYFHKNGLTDEEIKKMDLNLNINSLTSKIIELYNTYTVAVSTFDYEKLQKILENKFYLSTKKQLDNLKQLHHERIYENISIEEVKILSIQKKEQIMQIESYIRLNQTIDIKNSDSMIDAKEKNYEYKIILSKKDNIYTINNITTLNISLK